jgi:hypothetical protein
MKMASVMKGLSPEFGEVLTAILVDLWFSRGGA